MQHALCNHVSSQSLEYHSSNLTQQLDVVLTLWGDPMRGQKSQVDQGYEPALAVLPTFRVDAQTFHQISKSKRLWFTGCCIGHKENELWFGNPSRYHNVQVCYDSCYAVRQTAKQDAKHTIYMAIKETTCKTYEREWGNYMECTTEMNVNGVLELCQSIG